LNHHDAGARTSQVPVGGQDDRVRVLRTVTKIAAGAQRAVRVQLDALPRNLFVDPELRRAPDAVVSEALAVLSRRGTLARDGPLYRLTSERGDRRFPHVADMLTYQRNMLEETLEAAARLRGDG